ncbi:helix-turn-helix transcriptional regulator [Crossiella cryophila]|uniref:DNA-binding NarL/FixJ family response regulator n=1 Tax=Crossiella cryophila TaxID=43355 RepID=A0A7W7CHQ1_9PSEU|nr:response regulator transcription factor [Crossiella cryophila]MBB4679684.1 DNA-binding NarL/FixJ family response regulator [Crossiella cryophila]
MAAGLTDFLHASAELTVVPGPPPGDCDVTVLAAERVTSEVLAAMRRGLPGNPAPIVLLTGDLRSVDLLAMIECRVMAVLSCHSTSGDRLMETISAVAGGAAVLPPDLLGQVLREVERLHREVLTPNGLTLSGLSSRDLAVLRLMAEGLDTAEIAEGLDYSERTVNNIIYELTTRLGLRNRAHAVAYALRSGFI